MTFKLSWWFIVLLMAGLLLSSSAGADLKGISPGKACSLLNGIGLPTQGWKTYYDNETGCASRPKFLSSGDPFRNFISYNVEGNGHAVKQIRLIVSVLNPDESELAQSQFKNVAEFLIMKITSKPAPESIFHSIDNGIDLKLKIDGLFIEVTRKEWIMTTDWDTLQCYEIKLVIR